MVFRKSGHWMVIWDEKILEYLALEGPATPTNIADFDHIHVGSSHINRRLKKLEEHELVRTLGNGVYQATEQGALYLLGEYDAESHVVLTPMAEIENGTQPALMKKIEEGVANQIE
jgi:DNA-binding Lrp family transcriptional regulator